MAVFWVAAIALMMEEVQTSETLVKIFQTTRRYNPEDSLVGKACFMVSSSRLSGGMTLYYGKCTRAV
jgi:hypothetical protein